MCTVQERKQGKKKYVDDNNGYGEHKCVYGNHDGDENAH